MAFAGRVGPPWWDDRPLAIVGSGASLRGIDLGRLQGTRVLAVKGAMFDLPFAAAGFGLDAPRYQEWERRLGALPFPVFWAANPILIRSMNPPWNVTLLGRDERADVSDDPGRICAGGTSGFGAVNFAVLKKARQVALFGFDFGPTPGPSLGQHWHHNPQHFAHARDQDIARWRLWADAFAQIATKIKARGVTVTNASPDSLITCFPKVSVEQALADLRRL